ncbi:phage protein NinX family protein [Serratia quinivorans]|uniref:phage protein NinX family protein n=1 Tax=Serratia quinivorans TaxID=137545 RepID=UPI0039825A45
MTDYSKMSDFEVNKRVFKELTGHKPLGYPHHADGRSVGNPSNGEYLWYDYCNDPADAWPIIVKHGISLTHDYGEWESEACLDLPVGAHGTDELCSVGGIDKNPLRAAMIAFLLLKESEQCSS